MKVVFLDIRFFKVYSFVTFYFLQIKWFLKSVMDEGRDRGSKLGSFLDPDPWKILWIQIQILQNDLDPLDPDPQHCANVFMILPRYSLLKKSPQ